MPQKIKYSCFGVVFSDLNGYALMRIQINVSFIVSKLEGLSKQIDAAVNSKIDLEAKM